MIPYWRRRLRFFVQRDKPQATIYVEVGMTKWMVIGLWLSVLIVTNPAPMRAAEQGDYLADLGWGMATIGTNLLYMPAKLAYAITGGLVGSIAFLVSGLNVDAAQLVWAPSVGGAYVLTPRMLQGKEPVFFAGESYESTEGTRSEQSLDEEVIDTKH